MTTDPQTRRQTVEYFLQTRQPDDTWEDSSSFMDDLDWARQRLDVRQEKYPAFEHRIARRATTVVVEPVDAATASVPSAPVDRAELRDRIAAAMREHWLCTIRDEADADGNLPCRCGDWREPGAEVDDENDWDSHLADVALAVLPAPVDRAAVPVKQRADCTEIEWAEQERARFERLYTREYTRAEQAEDLLKVAHETSNRSEAERASAVQRAEEAEARAAAMEHAMESTAADALKHRGCHRDLMAQCLRAERAEAEAERLRADRGAVLAEVAEIADRTAAQCAPQTAAIVAGLAAEFRLMATGLLGRVADEEQQPETQATPSAAAFDVLMATPSPAPVVVHFPDQPPLVGTWHGGGRGTLHGTGELVWEPSITFPAAVAQPGKET